MSSKTITVQGASDDLICVSGAINAEFSPQAGQEGGYLAVSDGTVLVIDYDREGVWRIRRSIAGSAHYQHDEADGPDTERYYDVVTLTGDISWVVFGEVAK